MFKRIRSWIWRKITDRMVGALLDHFYARTGSYSGEWNLNPEDWQEVAYVMLCGLFGVKPKA